MFYALNWSLVAALLALWSLVAWALHAAAIWTVTNAGKLSGGASEVSVIRLPEAIAAWVPPEIVQTVNALIESLGPVIDRLLQAAPVIVLATFIVFGLVKLLPGDVAVTLAVDAASYTDPLEAIQHQICWVRGTNETYAIVTNNIDNTLFVDLPASTTNHLFLERRPGWPRFQIWQDFR